MHKLMEASLFDSYSKFKFDEVRAVRFPIDVPKCWAPSSDIQFYLQRLWKKLISKIDRLILLCKHCKIWIDPYFKFKSNE